MEIIDKIISKVGWDKALHYVCGFAIACFTAWMITDRTGVEAWRGAIVGFAIATVIGMAKELLDSRIDWWDFGATALGAATVVIASLII